MNKDYLERNRWRQISVTFLGNHVICHIDEDEQQHAFEQGHLDKLNQGIRQYLSGALLTPTLEYLTNNKLAVIADVSSMSDRYLLDTLYTKRLDLERLLPAHDKSDVYFFLYAGDSAYRSILESEYIYRTRAFDTRVRKIIGVYYDHCSKLGDNQILFGAIPKKLIAKEKFIPQFVQEIIDNQ